MLCTCAFSAEASRGIFRAVCLCCPLPAGERCEESEVHCRLPHPCLNGGTCQEAACLCPPGFLGLYCEHGESAGQAGWSKGQREAL